MQKCRNTAFINGKKCKLHTKKAHVQIKKRDAIMSATERKDFGSDKNNIYQEESV